MIVHLTVSFNHQKMGNIQFQDEIFENMNAKINKNNRTDYLTQFWMTK